LEIWTVKKILEWGIEFFKKKDIPQSRLSSELLLASVLGLSRMELYLNYDRVLTTRELAKYKKYILMRLEHMPVQYILGEAYFRSIKLKVDKNVLIPRPETELLAEKAIGETKRILDKIGSANILEIGTGSGAITLSLYSELLQELPDNKDHIKVISTDISQAAIEIAVKNAESILVDDWKKNIKFINCDIIPEDDRDWAAEKSKGFDLIVSNPPYIKKKNFRDLPREVKDYEPEEALVAGETGLEVYEKILSKIKGLLSDRSLCILFETDPTVGGNLVELAGKYLNAERIVLEKDYNQKERILSIYV